ncbi:response regulator transcription factor [Xylocopilactobacillus apis]|uniref:DNA-binding response regulator n=1 Tax=Xylocopilactobacillus apis TaxID=2932183 RepID=A0AAU9DNC1_9LACO|nr:response regulator transcription factor [Xylocopilactobacillus apis]BDR56423.1 DNA-binding response regulator [Xylocopilactobacillus apis]
MIKVLIVDDHAMVRMGISAYLEVESDIEVVGMATNGLEAIDKAKSLKPDVILMDLVMPELDGVEASKKILKNNPKQKIIILTSFIDDELVYPAIRAGATSYILKTGSADEIVEAIHKAIMGKSVFEEEVASKIKNNPDKLQEKELFETLTNRELEVLRLIGEGKTNKEIGDELFISLKTVKTHVSNILNKLDVQDRTQATIYAFKHGLVK